MANQIIVIIFSTIWLQVEFFECSLRCYRNVDGISTVRRGAFSFSFSCHSSARRKWKVTMSGIFRNQMNWSESQATSEASSFTFSLRSGRHILMFDEVWSVVYCNCNLGSIAILAIDCTWIRVEGEKKVLIMQARKAKCYDNFYIKKLYFFATITIIVDDKSTNIVSCMNYVNFSRSHSSDD